MTDKVSTMAVCQRLIPFINSGRWGRYHTCHCMPGFFNTSYRNIRCFEPNEVYTPQGEKPVGTLDSEGAWRGECCKQCPTPSDSASADDQCVDCTDIGSSVNEYGYPVGDHGIMKPRILAGFEESLTGIVSSMPDPTPVSEPFRHLCDRFGLKCTYVTPVLVKKY
jgi:hypothetical protein